MKGKIQANLGQALKKGDTLKVSTLRLLIAEIHNQEIEKRQELSKEEIITIVQKEVKKRQESIEAYQKGKREDLVKKEKKELEVLSEYLPRQLSPQELEKIIQSVIKKVNATNLSDFGKVMGLVMAEAKGRADGKVISKIVKNILDS
jgi:uncharacterized protein YqeY